MTASRTRKEMFIRSFPRQGSIRLNQFTDDAIDEMVSDLIFWRRLTNKINAQNKAIREAQRAAA